MPEIIACDCYCGGKQCSHKGKYAVQYCESCLPEQFKKNRKDYLMESDDL